MSTPVGHSRRQPLHEMQSDIVSAIASEVSASGPSWPDSARRSELARPRVKCCSSPVAVRGAHHAGVGFAAGAVVVAHLGGAGETAPFGPIERGLDRDLPVT